jgi:hypothetical protein
MAEERAAFPITECNQKVFSFRADFSRRVEVSFAAGQVSTEGGALLLRHHVYRSRIKRNGYAHVFALMWMPCFPIFLEMGWPSGQHKRAAISAHRFIWREGSKPKLYSKGRCQPWIENVLVCFVESQEPAGHEIVCGRPLMRVKRHP